MPFWLKDAWELAVGQDRFNNTADRRVYMFSGG